MNRLTGCPRTGCGGVLMAHEDGRRPFDEWLEPEPETLRCTLCSRRYRVVLGRLREVKAQVAHGN